MTLALLLIGVGLLCLAALMKPGRASFDFSGLGKKLLGAVALAAGLGLGVWATYLLRTQEPTKQEAPSVVEAATPRQTPEPTPQPTVEQAPIYVATPIPNPTLQPEPPKPTWAIEQKMIKIEHLKFLTKEEVPNWTEPNKIYADKFPASTPNIWYELGFFRQWSSKSREDYVQFPLIDVWKFNGVEFSRDQHTDIWGTGYRNVLMRGWTNRVWEKGSYTLDIYYDGIWVAHGGFEVY